MNCAARFPKRIWQTGWPIGSCGSVSAGRNAYPRAAHCIPWTSRRSCSESGSASNSRKTLAPFTVTTRPGAVWAEVYPKLSEGRPGLLGAATSRAEAQVMRLATIYALLDKSAVVRAEHLMAALAVWEYAEQSAKYIFGSALGDPTADAILRALRRAPRGHGSDRDPRIIPAAQRRRGNQPSPQRAGRGRPGAQRVTGGHGRTPAGGLVCPYIDLRQKRSKRGKGRLLALTALIAHPRDGNMGSYLDIAKQAIELLARTIPVATGCNPDAAVSWP